MPSFFSLFLALDINFCSFGVYSFTTCVIFVFLIWGELRRPMPVMFYFGQLLDKCIKYCRALHWLESLSQILNYWFDHCRYNGSAFENSNGV